MPLAPLFGHDGVKRRLAGAVAAGRLPQVLLFEGPRGAGKQRLALWLGQLLLCRSPKGGEPCGQCQDCHLALNLSHPDLHWFVPVELTKKGGDADKQVELAEEALGEEMAARRAEPLYPSPRGGGLAAHGIASVRLLLKRMSVTPALGGRKVFLLGDAERLVAQQGAEAAANALLKALEEPPSDTVLVLTAAEPEALLPTILSRVVRVRVARVADSIVTAFAQKIAGVRAKDELAQRVAVADGCIGKLLATRDDVADKSAGQAEKVLEAVAKGPAGRYALALGQAPFQARGGFTDMLDELAGRLRAEARRGGDTGKLVAAIARVMDARELAQGNVNPQLLAAVLTDDLVGVR